MSPFDPEEGSIIVVEHSKLRISFDSQRPLRPRYRRRDIAPRCGCAEIVSVPAISVQTVTADVLPLPREKKLNDHLNMNTRPPTDGLCRRSRGGSSRLNSQGMSRQGFRRVFDGLTKSTIAGLLASLRTPYNSFNRIYRRRR
jgi:hypothetical protein